MHLLTGASSSPDTSSGPTSPTFRFVPQTIVSFGPTVLAEGCETARSIAWVHAWTVTHGIITQVREYFNTSLSVTRLGGSAAVTATNSNASSPSTSDLASTSSSSSTAEITSLHCPFLWESTVSNWVGKSVPGLVLAI
uniref:Wound-induced protein 1 n=1 Tax=Fagus sylvatica TaxID=28930 RepID=A0A2N9J7D6_FAGSY